MIPLQIDQDTAEWYSLIILIYCTMLGWYTSLGYGPLPCLCIHYISYVMMLHTDEAQQGRNRNRYTVCHICHVSTSGVSTIIIVEPCAWSSYCVIPSYAVPGCIISYCTVPWHCGTHTSSYHPMLYHVHTIICCTPYIMYHHIMVRPSLCTVIVCLGETSGQTPYRGLVHMYHVILCCTMSIPSYAVPLYHVSSHYGTSVIVHCDCRSRWNVGTNALSWSGPVCIP